MQGAVKKQFNVMAASPAATQNPGVETRQKILKSIAPMGLFANISNVMLPTLNAYGINKQLLTAPSGAKDW